MISQFFLNVVVGSGILICLFLIAMLLIWIFEFIQENDRLRNILFLILTAAVMIGTCYVVGKGVRSLF